MKENTDVSEYWHPTMRLRWYINGENAENQTLQQMWQSNLGNTEWRFLDIFAC